MSQANNETPAVLADFLGGLEPPEVTAAEPKQRKGKTDFAAMLKAGKLTEDMLDPHNDEHHEWINKCREAEAEKPIWIRPKPNENEMPGPNLYIGVNGRDYYLPFNRWCKIPRFVQMHLATCTKVQQIREHEELGVGKFVATIEAERFPYDISETEPRLSGKDKPVLDFYR